MSVKFVQLTALGDDLLFGLGEDGSVWMLGYSGGVLGPMIENPELANWVPISEPDNLEDYDE